jgi:hypothetical protein
VPVVVVFEGEDVGVVDRRSMRAMTLPIAVDTEPLPWADQSTSLRKTRATGSAAGALQSGAEQSRLTSLSERSGAGDERRIGGEQPEQSPSLSSGVIRPSLRLDSWREGV